jgi:hypothetical protein
LLWSQVAAVVRVVRKDEVEAEAAEDGQDALNEKQPAPAGNSLGTIKAGDNATGEQTTNSRCNATGSVKNADTLSCKASSVNHVKPTRAGEHD